MRTRVSFKATITQNKVLFNLYIHQYIFDFEERRFNTAPYSGLNRMEDTATQPPFKDVKKEGWITMDIEPTSSVTNLPEETVRVDDPSHSELNQTEPYQLSIWYPESAAVKTDPLELEADQANTYHGHLLWHKHKSDPESIGSMLIYIKETTMCRISLYTGWSLLISKGLLKMVIHSRLLNSKNIIRLSLKRKHPEFSYFPIDKICEKHQAAVPFSLYNVLQSGPNEENWIFESSSQHKYIVYFFHYFGTYIHF